MSAQVDRILAALTKDVGDGIKVVVLEVHAELVEATPVDTGNARANWIAGLSGSVPTAPVGSGDAVDTAAQAAGMAQVAAYKLEQGSLSIVNNVEYLESLDAGSSTQAPAGFVRMAVETGVAKALAKVAR